MKEKFETYKTKTKDSWGSLSKATKWLMAASFFITLLALGLFVFFNSQTNMSPLYSNLDPAEAGEIKAAIETKEFQSKCRRTARLSPSRTNKLPA